MTYKVCALSKDVCVLLGIRVEILGSAPDSCVGTFEACASAERAYLKTQLRVLWGH